MLSPWSKQVLGDNAETITPSDDWFDYLHPKDVESVQDAIDRSRGTEIYQVDYRWQGNAGQDVWLRELGRRIYENADEREGLIFSIREQKELENTALIISEREKRKLGRDLHDDLCQQLAGMLFFTDNLIFQINRGKDRGALFKSTSEIKAQLQLCIEKTRCLARGLNPIGLGKKTFRECLTELIEQSQKLYAISCRLQINSDLHVLERELGTHLFRITQEAIHNAVRHGRADQISITLQSQGDGGILIIRDNGSGLKPARKESTGRCLHNMRSRATMIEGSIDIVNHEEGGVLVLCKFGKGAN